MNKKASEMMGVTFTGSVTFNGPMFDIHDNENVYIGHDMAAGEGKEAERPELDDARLTKAIEACQSFFWAQSSYAVVFCVCRDRYDIKNNMTAFEHWVESLHYNNKRTYKCPKGTLTNAFTNNSIFKFHINQWDLKDPTGRIIKLRDKLIEQLDS